MKLYFTLEIGDESWIQTWILMSSVILIQLQKLFLPDILGKKVVWKIVVSDIFDIFGHVEILKIPRSWICADV